MALGYTAASTTTEPSRVTLRYFDCRGRGQALRYLLVDLGVDFGDEIFPADRSWLTHRTEAAVSGPFSSLPVLAWGEHVIGQTLAIAGYVSRRLGHYQQRSAEDIARLESVTAAAYLELTCVLPDLLRPRVMPESAGWAAFLAGFVRSVPNRLPAFEQLLAQQSTSLFGGVDPVAADYFVFEGIDAWLELLGTPFVQALDACPRLRAQRDLLLGRPRLKAYLASNQRPRALTASPHEPDIRERLRAHIAAGPPSGSQSMRAPVV